VVLAVDVSGSTGYGSVSLSKRELAAEAAAILGFSALHNGDKVGMLVFAEEPLLYVPPAKGTRHLLRIVREILTARPDKPGTSVAEACDFLIRTLRRRSLVVLVSDFHSDPLDKPLGKLARKHETIALRVIDPLEAKLPKAGRVTLIDPETGFETQVNTNNPNLRMAYSKLMRRHHEGTEALFKKHGIDAADLETDRDSLPALHQLLRKRSRKRSA
jgi:uncharacterized protein (DUF58 family)